MAINSDDAHVTIDFKWVKDENSTDIGYNIKHHYTKGFGQTISISENGGEDYYAFPAKMFSEVVDFLRNKKILEDPRDSQKLTDSDQEKTSLPLPVVTTDRVEKKAQDIAQNDPISLTDVNVPEPIVIKGDPIESFADMTDPVAIAKAAEETNEDDAKQMAQERKDAQKKASSSKKQGIKSSHIDKTEAE